VGGAVTQSQQQAGRKCDSHHNSEQVAKRSKVGREEEGNKDSRKEEMKERGTKREGRKKKRKEEMKDGLEEGRKEDGIKARKRKG
jgi:hypothetical protein